MFLSRTGRATADNFNLDRFWKLEEIGIKDSPEQADDEVALKSHSTIP